MGAEDALLCFLEHAAIVDAAMHEVVHRMGVKAQIKSVSLEKIVIDQ